KFLLKLNLHMLELLALLAMFLLHLGYLVHDGQKSLLTYILNQFFPVNCQLMVLAYYSSSIICLYCVSMRSLLQCSLVIIACTFSTACSTLSFTTTLSYSLFIFIYYFHSFTCLSN